MDGSCPPRVSMSIEHSSKSLSRPLIKVYLQSLCGSGKFQKESSQCQIDAAWNENNKKHNNTKRVADHFIS